MEEDRLRINHSELQKRVLPLLIGRVFHVTSANAFSSILLDRTIKTNETGMYPFSYGQSENSFFRKRGCVSVCDLRNISDAEINTALMKYNFLNPCFGKDANIYLFIKSDCHNLLVSWKKWHDEKAYTEMVVPHIEAGYPGDVDLNLIEMALHVKVEYSTSHNGQSEG